MRRLYLIFIISTIACKALYPQNMLYKAQLSEREFKFQEAIEIYLKALPKAIKNGSNDLPLICYKLGNCYRNVNDYEKAHEYYLKSLQSGIHSDDGYFMIGEALLGLCRYDEAISTYRKMLQNDVQSDLESKALVRIEMAEKASKNENPIPDFTVRNMEMFNTEYSEFGVFYSNSRVFYSSMKKQNNGNRTDKRTLQGYSNIYVSSLNRFSSSKSGNNGFSDITGIWTKPEVMPSPFNSKEYNEGTLAMDENEHTAYVMQCKGKNGECHIIEIKYNENFRASDVEKLDLGQENYSIGHPCLCSDGQKMYFISDMPGGAGGTDIWYTLKQSDGTWGNPVNAGLIINTAGDEMFTSLFEDRILIFSSNGLKGFGGLDLFYTYVSEDGRFSEPVNFGLPVNSGADDFSMTYSPEIQGGFFCSNRPGGKGSDDIYYYSGLPFRVRIDGFVCDKNTKRPLSDAVVIISVKNEFTDTLYSNAEGKFDYRITPGKNYIFDVYKNEYSQNLQTIIIDEQDKQNVFFYADVKNKNLLFELYPNKTGIGIQGTVTESTTKEPLSGQQMIIVDPKGYFDQTITDEKGTFYFGDLTDNTTYIIMLTSKGYWTRKKVLEIPKLSRPMTFSAALSYDMDFQAELVQTYKEIVLYDIYYEFDKATLIDSSKTELDKIVELLKENPNLTVELSAHTDERGNDLYNVNLSQRRAQSVVDYLVNKGVSKNNLIAKGYGKTQPLIKNAKTEHEHQLNRRTAFKVLQISDQNIELIVQSVASELPYSTIGDLKYSNADPSVRVSLPIASSGSNIVYKVQILALFTQINDVSYFNNALAQIKEISIVEEYDPAEKLYRYYAGTFSTMDEAVRLKNKLRNIGYDSFIKVFKSSEQISKL